MPRGNRISCAGLIWHITHRCHQKAFLLRFARDRRRWRHWLFKAQRRYGLCILNYIVTSNHVHLLVIDQGRQEVARSLQLVASRVAQEYNRRKSRNGAYWEDRYHATAVQSSTHLLRCMTYIDLNMVRTGRVIHPAEWDVCGYAEIQAPWRRKGVIDFRALCDLLGERSLACLARRLRKSVESEINSTVRQACWTSSVGVGDELYLQQLRERLGPQHMHREIETSKTHSVLREQAVSYFPRLAMKKPD